MAKIDELFRIMVEKGASDMHLSAGAPPILRLHGSMSTVEEYPQMDNAGIQELVFEILTDKQKNKFIENWELDCSYYIEGLSRFRVNVFMQRRGMGAVFRVIPTEIMSASQLGLPKEVTNLTNTTRGLILVTGPTGSGKSTTLAAMIHQINLDKPEHILTIEDPIEFVHENKKSLINQREVGAHTKSFNNALKAALREDPDIILVGEMRDLETIELAMTAAETGHLVFGTLHTNSAASTVDRIIDVFPTDRQSQIRVMLSESLRGVVAQTLFKRADKPGRVAGLEVLVNTKAVGNLIREGKTFQIPSTMQTSASEGMITFEQSLTKLVEDGKISLNDAETFLGKKLRGAKANQQVTSPSGAGLGSVKNPGSAGLGAVKGPAPQAFSPDQKGIELKKPGLGGSPAGKPSLGGASPAKPAEGGGIKITGTSDNDEASAPSSGGLKITSTSDDDAPKKGEGGLLSGFGFKKKSS